MANEITLCVPPGIGDIVWIYQKFSLLFDVINFQICVIDETSPVQKRAKDWLKLLPNCGDVSFKLVSLSTFKRLMSATFSVDNVLKSNARFPNRGHYYSCNALLERGVRIVSMDNYPVQVDIDLPWELFKKGFLVAYASGSNPYWTSEKWIYFLKKILERFGKVPVAVIGALYDAHVSREIAEGLVSHGFEVEKFIDLEPRKVLGLLKESRCFVGHQSGLNILADQLGVRQIMVYINELNNMRFSWAKQSHINSKIYNSCLFGDSQDNVVASLPDDFYQV
jgi:hypothetical protein